ncbi:Von Willebrand Factor A Domain-Containing Protein 2 [Manis pentadactyla]|nr:Von Willebrand Factor A Domain-Containing Protein 2 [Manis pentadactyla]
MSCSVLQGKASYQSLAGHPPVVSEIVSCTSSLVWVSVCSSPLQLTAGSAYWTRTIFSVSRDGAEDKSVCPSLHLQEVYISRETIGKISAASKMMQCSAAEDILFLIDGSHSLGKGSFERAKHFAVTVCDALNISLERIFIIVTDGGSQGHVALLAKQLKERGITVFAVGVHFPSWKRVFVTHPSTGYRTICPGKVCLLDSPALSGPLD